MLLGEGGVTLALVQIEDGETVLFKTNPINNSRSAIVRWKYLRHLRKVHMLVPHSTHLFNLPGF